MRNIILAWTRAMQFITERKPIRFTALFFVLLAPVFIYISIYAGSASAAPNNSINFQARILTNTGALVADGFYTVEFNIYATQSGGTTQWTETQVITSKNGYITASLGSVNPFGSSIDWSQEQWLSMNINSDGEMAPRMKITAVPFSIRSGQADALTTTGGTLSANDLAQLAPGLVQSVSSANTALRINQTGAGSLLQLQGNGTDVFTVSKAGDVIAAAGLTVGASTSTTAGTIRWSGVDFEGYDGSQWVSLTAGTGGGGTGNSSITLTSSVANMAGTATTSAGLLAFTSATAVSSAIGTTTGFVAPADGSFRSCVVNNNAAITGGSISVRWRVNGVSVGAAACTMNTSNPRYGASTIDPGVVTFSAGDTINIAFESAGLLPAGSTEYTAYWTVEYGGNGVPSNAFVQGGNTYGATAVLGTSDNFGLNFITNGLSRMSVSNTGAVDITNGLTVGNSLTVSSGGIAVTGNSTLNGTLSGLTGLTVASGSAVLNGGLDLNSSGITNTGNITGLGTSLSATNGLTISTGVSGSLTLDAGNDIVVLNDATLQRTAAGTTILELNDTSDTVFSITNTDGTAVANLNIEGLVTAQGFSGDGSSLTNLDASDITTGTLSDSRLSSNVALLTTTQSFSGLQTFSDALVVGNTASATAGAIRWNGVDFEGYDGSQWVSFTTGGGGGGTGNSSITFTSSVTNMAGTATTAAGLLTFTSGTTVSNVAGTTTGFVAPADGSFRSCVVNNNAAITAGSISVRWRVNGVSVGAAACTMNTSNPRYGASTIDAGVVSFSAGDTINIAFESTGMTPAASTEFTAYWTVEYGGNGVPSNAFVQGGNNYGATALLGTTDANGLNLITNGLTRVSITSGGDTTVSGLLTASGDLSANANAFFNGDVTIGNAATDVLTLQADSLVLPNGLDINNGTLVIDSAANKIGINASSVTNTLTINTAATADSTAEVLIYTNGINQKGLVLQTANGQVANAFEVQADSGAVLIAVGADGSLNLGNDSATPTAGVLVLNDSTAANGFTSVLGTSSLTGNRNISLPDASGTICISGSTSCGFIALAPSVAQVDSSTNSSLFINKTGASGDILTLQKNGTTILSMLNSGALQLSLTDSAAFTVKNAGGTDFFNVDTSGGLVRIGSATADGTGVLFVLDSKNTAGDPTGTNGGQYYNSSSNKFRCFENGTWTDCIYQQAVRSFIDTTSDAAVDANTTNYWDTAVENNNSTPNLTPSATSKSIMGVVSVETNATGNTDVEFTARVERGIGSVPTCGSGTVVGSRVGTFSTNTGTIKTSTTQFIDNPNTTSQVFYVVCSDTATNGTAVNVTQIRVTLQELNNSN